MTLIYRAQVFNFEPQSLPVIRQPRAINWRYQKSGEIDNQVTERPVYHQPRALNWRYCLNS